MYNPNPLSAGHSCPFYTRDGVGIMESPNYPRQFPARSECRWRVSPGHTRRMLLILPRLSLPPDCSTSFTVSRSDQGQSTTVFSTCSSTSSPTILTGHSNNLWVEFKAGSKSVARGFQLTILSVQGQSKQYINILFLPYLSWSWTVFWFPWVEELGYLVDAVINSGEITSFDSDSGAGNLSQDDKILLSRLLLLLNPAYQAVAPPESAQATPRWGLVPHVQHCTMSCH